MIEWTISLGNIVTSVLTLVGFVLSAGAFLYALRISIDRNLEATRNLTLRVSGVEFEIKQLTKVVVEQAVQQNQIMSLTQRLDRVQGELNDLRRRKGDC